MQGNPFRTAAVRAAAAAAAAVLALAACSSDSGSDDGEPWVKPRPSSGPSQASQQPDAGQGDGPPLVFAPVRTSVTGACPSASKELTWLADTSDPGAPVCYGVMEETALRAGGPVEAEAAFSQEQGVWVIRVSLSGADAKKFGELTERVSTQSPPQNQLAIVLGAWEDEPRVLSAPSVVSPLLGGQLEITGGFDQKSAEALAAELNR